MSSVWNTTETLLMAADDEQSKKTASPIVGTGKNSASVKHLSRKRVIDSDNSESVHSLDVNIVGANDYSDYCQKPEKVEKASRHRSSLPPAVAAGLARHHAQQNVLYQKKYRNLKQIVRNLVLENAALCDYVAEVQQSVIFASEERRSLLKRFFQCQNVSENDNQLTAGQATTSVCFSGTEAEKSKAKHAVVKKKPLETVIIDSSGLFVDKTKIKKEEFEKPKRLCPPVRLDSAGRPLFPLSLGQLTIHSLGTIVSDRNLYHTEEVIFPVGFSSSRTYASLRDPTRSAHYTCKVLDGGIRPRFEVICEEDEKSNTVVISGSSAAECLNRIYDTVNFKLGINIISIKPDSSDSDSRGLKFFGLSHPSVQNVLQTCPGARRCAKYKWHRFEVCKTEADILSVFESEREAFLCHESLQRNIRFARQHMPN